MSIRPRYSLLAFLLFTAAVAGGVKLWRGPHHVVDRSNPQMEDEYTYYHDWDGTKVMDGVRVRRYSNNEKIVSIYLDQYRDGERIVASFGIVSADSTKQDKPRVVLLLPGQRGNEKELFEQAVRREMKLFRAHGHVPIFDNVNDFRDR